MKRRPSFQFVESGGPERFKTQGYDRVREKHPEEANEADVIEQPATSKRLAFPSLDRGRKARDGD